MPLGGLATGAGAAALAGGGLATGGAIGSGVLGLGSLAASLLGGGKKDSAPKLAATNPATQALASLFGGVFRSGRNGGFFNDKKKVGIFEGPDFENAIRDFIYNPTPVSQGETGLLDSVLGGGAPQRTLDTTLNELGGLSGILGGGIDMASELSRTGAPVDANPLYQTAISNFQRNVLPAIAERQGVLGGGIRSQGFVDTASREGANLLDQAAAQNVSLQNDAAQRRLTSLGLLGSLTGQQAALSTARASLPASFAGDILNLGTTYRNAIETQRARPLQAFAQLAQLGNPGNIGLLQTGYNPQSGTADILSSLASNAGGIAGLLQGLGGLGGRPGA